MMYANVIKTRSCPRTHRVIIAKIESDLYILSPDETTRDQTKTKIKKVAYSALPCTERFSSQTALLTAVQAFSSFKSICVLNLNALKDLSL